jgi:CubicO group peptidase (beta-lactamase class C family)
MKKLDTALLSDKITARVQADLEAGNLSGASLQVRQCGETVFRFHFGTVAPGGDVPVTDGTLFRLASMTKPITAVAVMTLFDRGLLDIFDPIAKYLPQFADRYLAEADGDEIRLIRPVTVQPTILHLLTHTSGLFSSTLQAAYRKTRTPEDNRTLDNAIRWYAGQGLGFDPYTKTEYSGTAAFDLLAKIVEAVADMPYEDYLRETIFTPCAMTDTTFVPSDDQWARLIALHDLQDGKPVAHSMPAGHVFGAPVTHPLGGAGLISSLADYSAFADMLLSEGTANGRRILSKLAVRMLSTPHVPKSIMPGPVQWGLGMRVITGEAYPYGLAVGSFGWSGAYGTHFWIDPENQVIAIYMKNSQIDGGSRSESGRNFEIAVNNSFERT